MLIRLDFFSAQISCVELYENFSAWFESTIIGNISNKWREMFLGAAAPLYDPLCTHYNIYIIIIIMIIIIIL